MSNKSDQREVDAEAQNAPAPTAPLGLDGQQK